jgi:hypothetical protein
MGINESYSIIYGTILSKDEYGLDLEVIEMLRGEETKTQIRIWDGTDFDCNDNHDMSVQHIGQINDTIIISLPKIAEIENDWDVIGDYRRPDPFTFISQLRIENGIAIGLIKGDAIAPPEFNIESLEYSKLREFILSNNDCADLTSSTKDLIENDYVIYPNPSSSLILIDQGDYQEIKEVNLYSLQGKLLMRKNTIRSIKIQLEIDHLKDGVYIIEMKNKDNSVQFSKIVKSQ